MSGLTKIGDYEVQHVATVGGVVRYEATHAVLPRRAMIDVVDCTTPRTTAIRLMRQACILEALHHPGVPRVFECGMVDGRPWVAYERTPGLSLEAELRARKLDAIEVVDVVEQIATILTHAHARGVLHRNVTPATLLRDPHRGHLVLADWSTACTLDTELPRALEGKTRYRAPELIDNHRSAEGRADVFSLGMIALDALTRGAATVAMRAEDIPVEPPALATLLAEMVADVPALRPTAAEVVETVRRIRSDGTIHEHSDSRTTAEYATFEVTRDIDPMVEVALEEDASSDEPILLDKPRPRPRWTPQWSIDSRSTLPFGVVEIAPRRRER